MSFTSDIKKELSRIELSDNSERAQLSALVQMLSALSISSSGLSLQLKSTSIDVIKRVSYSLQSLYQIKGDITMVRQNNLNKANVYTMIVSEKVKDILYDLDLWTDRGLLEHPHMAFLNNDEMIRSYIAGCFLAGGSVNSPSSTNYHLEIKANTEGHGSFLLKLLEKKNIEAKMTLRRNHYVVYVKSAEKISDMLALMGANEAIMEFEDERIRRDYYNSIYRLENVKIANEQKSLKVADQQVGVIQFLKQRDLLHYLSEKDQQIAAIRLENPNASLNELSEMYQKQSGILLSKSGIRHRFEKIFALAEKYNYQQED